MNASDLWNMFLETGAPEFYLLYTNALRMEDKNVSDDQRTGVTGYGLQ